MEQLNKFRINYFTSTLFFLLVIPAVMFSQDSTAVQSKAEKNGRKPEFSFLNDTLTPYGKNEFAFNLAPFVSTLLGGFPDNQFRISLFYKRQIKSSQNHLRFGLTYCPTVNNNFFTENPNDLYFVTGDSTRIRSSVSDNGRKPIQFNFGLEHWGKNHRRLAGYYSVDLLCGMYFRNYTLIDNYEKLDENSEWVYDDDPDSPRISINDYQTSFNWYVGMSANAGLRYAISKRFFLTAQIGFEAVFGQTKTYLASRWGDFLYANEYYNFDFSTNSIVNEFAIAYRF